MSSKPKFQFHARVNNVVHVADLFVEIKITTRRSARPERGMQASTRIAAINFPDHDLSKSVIFFEMHRCVCAMRLLHA